MPVAKKYEMLGDRDATKLKLELEGGTGEKHREKKGSSATETSVTPVTPGSKEIEGEEETEKKEECMDISNTEFIAHDAEESFVEDSATDQSIKENATNVESAINKDSQIIAYDPNIAIGKIQLDNLLCDF